MGVLMAEWFWSFGPLIVVGVVLTVAIVFVRWRIGQFAAVAIDEGERDRMAGAVLTDLRAHCSGPREPIAVLPSYWRELGWSNDKLLKLLQYMTTRGWIVLPDFDWRLQRILRLELPRTVALTPSSYEEYSPSRLVPPVVVNGPAHFGGGDQVFHGEVRFSAQEVERRIDELIIDLRRDRAHRDAETAHRVAEVVEILGRANESRAYHEPQLRAALRWLAGFATDATANAAGAGIAATAAALLGLLAS